MIKKIFLLMFILLLLTGCNNNVNDTTNISPDEDLNIPLEQVKDEYVDDNPIKVSLYDGNKKITTYNVKLVNLTDIGVFDVCYTDIDTLNSSNIRDNYPKYYSEYDNIDDYKTGFYIYFEVDGNIWEELVLDPSSQYKLTPYMYIYLYDDVNQTPGTYYSHLTMDDIDDDTIISSIKLFLGEEAIKISSSITLTVFTYDGEDDFDEDKRYRGNSSYTITINLK